MKQQLDRFNYCLALWDLMPDGEPIVTRSSQLLPVRWQHRPAMLKLALSEEEASGNALMAWWNGNGAARVFAQEGPAILLERATGKNSLADYTRNGHDEEACRIICNTAAKLHQPKHKPYPALVPLRPWFSDLTPATIAHGGVLAKAAASAEALLAEPRDVTALHGDIHHNNILDFGARGWLAIDPKGLLGERAFDYANLFCNPDHDIATNQDIFNRRLEIVCRLANLDHLRLSRWILAWAGLSAAWNIIGNRSPETALAVAELAAAELRR